MEPAFVDVQGFQVTNKQFIIKEFAVLLENKVQHFIFSPPYHYRMLSVQERKSADWLYYNHHGFDWMDGHSPYYKHRDVIKKYVPEERTVYVKGLDKVKWLSEICNVDINDANAYDWGDYRIKDSLDDVKLPACMSHDGVCTLRNVYCMKQKYDNECVK